jgi:serine/threonine protein kinase
MVDEIEVTESNGGHPIGTRLARKRLGPQWVDHPKARARFEQEIAALMAMNHPNIITVQGTNVGGERFYCMPRCARSWRQVLDANNGAGFEWRSVARLGITIANALHYAHSLGFVHRDLKPENLLLDAVNNLYLADWGIGYFVHRDSKVLKKITTHLGGLGTEYYCSLEQWSGASATPRMDIYALGMTLAEMVTGAHEKNFTIGFGLQRDIVAATIPGAAMFNGLLRQMTAMVADRRVASMEHVVTSLNQVIIAGATPGFF